MRPARSSAATFRASPAQSTLADGLQRFQGVGPAGGSVVGARRSQPLSDRAARHLDDQGGSGAGTTGVDVCGMRRARSDADGSRHSMVERAGTYGRDLADGVANAARHRVALERIPASANPGQSRTVSRLAATRATTAWRARSATAAVAGPVSPRIQPGAAARSIRHADSGEPVASERA